MNLLTSQKRTLLHGFIIIITIIIIITYVQGIYNYTPETIHALGVHSVFRVFAVCNVIVQVQYVLYFYISTFLRMCAVPSVAVFCSS